MKEDLRVLILEDRATDAELALRELNREGLKVTSRRVMTEAGFLEGLGDEGLDMVLADYSLPSYNGLLALILARKMRPDVPFIFVTGTLGEETAIDAMRHGATDYVLKQRLERLGPAVSRALREVAEHKQRLQAEDALALEHEKLRHTLAASPAVVYTLKLQEGIIAPVLVSDNIDRLLGVSAAESERPGWWKESLHPEDRERVLAKVRNELGRNDFSMEYRIRHKDGSYRWIEDKTRVVPRSDDGTKGVQEIVGVWTDITSRKEVELKLRETQTWAESFLANVSDSYSLLDQDWRIIYVNHAAEVTIRTSPGRPDEEIVGRNIWELYPDFIGTALERNYCQAMELRIPLSFEFHDVVRDTWWYSRLVPLPDGLAVFATDITDRKSGEEAQEQRIHQANLMADISLALTQRDSVRELLRRCLDTIRIHLDVAFARIWTYDEEEDLLELQASARDSSTPDETQARVPIKPLKDGLIALERKPYMTNHVAGDPRIPDQEWAQRENLVAFAGYPLIVDDELVGTISLYSRKPFGRFAAKALATAADTMAVGIRQKRATERLNAHVGQLTALRNIEVAIASSLNLPFVLRLLVSEVRGQLKADAIDILLLDESTGTLTYSEGEGFRTGAFALTRLKLGEGLAGGVALSGRAAHGTLLSPETVRNNARREWMEAEEFATYTAFPLVAKGKVTGVIEFFHRSEFTPLRDWKRFAEALAGQAARAIENATLFGKVQTSNWELQLAYETTLHGWSAALDLRDRETEGHTQRVTETTVELARSLGFSEEELVQIRRGAMLHDIGKMGVPDEILHKPGPLTEEEWVIMRTHPVLAYELLYPIEYLRPALDIPYCHHEKWNGSGYPRGLKGEQIPRAARIFSVVDIWDALRSDRPYRAGWPEERVLEHLKSISGVELDPEAVEAFLMLKQEGAIPPSVLVTTEHPKF